MRQFVDKATLYLGKESSKFRWLLDQGIEEFMPLDPGSEPLRERKLSPAMSGLERCVLELRKPAGETSLQRLVVPDNPDATCWRCVCCPG